LKRCRHQALVERLKHYDPLATRDDDATEPDHVLALHRFTDDGKGVLPDVVFGG
jgi:hypothetical protein